ncbi:hypothetical protein MTBSS4_40195 [Magnetospirillum sp. SS-4]|nr:hypothetical protein MTBSS4_40195 [Magnetospirillum sp. SS-4]
MDAAISGVDRAERSVAGRPGRRRDSPSEPRRPRRAGRCSRPIRRCRPATPKPPRSRNNPAKDTTPAPRLAMISSWTGGGGESGAAIGLDGRPGWALCLGRGDLSDRIAATLNIPLKRFARSVSEP